MGDKNSGEDQGSSHPRSGKKQDGQPSELNNTNDTKLPTKIPTNTAKPPSQIPDTNAANSKPPKRMPSNTNTSQTPSRMPSNTASDPKTPSKMPSNNSASPETSNFAELQKRLQGEVARAVDMWRKGMVQGTLESQNERIESFIKQLKDDKLNAKDKTSCSILAELNRENDQLRIELEEMRKLDVNDITVERLQELQHDNKNLRAVIAKLQEEVQEKNTVHHRKIREQQDIIRKSQANAGSSESAVNKLRAENQELKAKVAELIKTSEEEETGITKKGMNCQFCPSFDLTERLSKAEHRLHVACTELNLKRKHHKRIPAHSVKSLEDIACVWTQQVNFLRMLLKKEKEMNMLKDRLDMFVSNIEILKNENSELSTRLGAVKEDMKRFRENPMKPTEQVTKNVNLLLHMEKIDGSLAEKAVQLDKNEKDLKREQLRVREILIRVEELRRENRHFARRLQKDAAKKAYESRSVVSSIAREDSSSSCSNSDQLQSIGDQIQSINLDPMYATTLEEGDGLGIDPSLDETYQPYRPEETDVDHTIPHPSESDGTDVQGSDGTADQPTQEESDANDPYPPAVVEASCPKSRDNSRGS